jgi:hypothetical protein
MTGRDPTQSSLVSAWAHLRIAGAANNTTGNIVIHAIRDELSQCVMNEPSEKNGTLATAAATMLVTPA